MYHCEHCHIPFNNVADKRTHAQTHAMPSARVQFANAYRQVRSVRRSLAAGRLALMPLDVDARTYAAAVSAAMAN